MDRDTEHAKRHIKHNITLVHAIEDVAVALDVSSEVLRKEFRRREGISLSKFIKQTKVEHAKKLLEETENCCKSICFDAGFSREDSGARTFKQATGMTMLEYRKAIGKRD